MDCGKYKSALSDAAAGAIAAEQQRTLDEHLARCAACAARLERLRRAMAAIDRALAEPAKAEPSPEFLASAGARCNAPRASRMDLRNVPQPAVRQPSWAHVSARTVAAAAAVLALVAAAWMLRSQFKGPLISPKHLAPPFTATVVGRAAQPETPSRSATPKLAPRTAPTQRKPSLAAAKAPHQRIVPRKTPVPNRRFLEMVKVPAGEKTALIQLYALLQSRKVNPRSLFPPAQNLDQPLKIAPLRIKPISIPLLEISRISHGSHDPSPDLKRPTASQTETTKETIP